MKSRPDGYDYTKPDPVELRCTKCNKDGMNRTGWFPIGYIGATTTCRYAVDCPYKCKNGLLWKMTPQGGEKE